ncbi:MAG: rod shape-determining protein MreC [Parcubacteria group bacterium Licking1014_17]|nr:MAG: rod shape-determining protein MreC [Parcubacteria group bacterium Licking1014_17]
MAIIFAVLSVAFRGFPRNIVFSLTERIAVPVNRFFLGLSVYTKALINVKQLAGENAKLSEENRLLLGKVSESDRLKRENDLLRSQLNLTGSEDRKLLLAEVVSYDKSPISSAIILNKGSNDGVKKSMTVVVESGVLAGVVREVYDDSCLVFLVDDSRVRISVRGLASQVVGYARGDFQKGLRLELIGKNEQISVGETLVTSGLDALPSSLTVGKITSAESSNGDLFQNISAEPLYSKKIGAEMFIILK